MGSFLFSCRKAVEYVEESSGRFWLKDDTTNIAILIVDYLTYNFEGGTVQYYPLPNSITTDSLPFEIEYLPPSDFGHIIFKLPVSHDTLFYGTIIWHGQGEIKYPQEILPSDSFGMTTYPINEPLSVNHYEDISLSFLQNLSEKADTAWNVVKTLDITKQFSESTYRLGLYLYPPTVGLFISSRAKWIIFLYSERYNSNTF